MVSSHIVSIFSEYVKDTFSHDNFPISSVDVDEDGINLILLIQYETTIDTNDEEFYKLLLQYGNYITSHLDKYFIHTAWIEKSKTKYGGFKLSVIMMDDIVPELLNSLHQVESKKDLARLRFQENSHFYQLIRHFSLPFLFKNK